MMDSNTSDGDGGSRKLPYKVCTDSRGQKEIIWRNTYIDKPTLADVRAAVAREFPGIPEEELGILAGIMSLTVKAGHSVL